MSGGGMRGLAHIGALEVLQERGLLKAVKEYIGISAGSFCAFAICIGCTLAELRMASALLDFGRMQNINPEDAFKFMESFGFDTGENMEKLLTVLLKAKGRSPTMTFTELDALGGPKLRIFATDLNTCMPKEFSALLTPGAEVRHALRASMSIPIYFTPVKDADGHMLVDGGVITSMPFALLSREDRDTTLNIAFNMDHMSCSEIPSLFSFLSQLYSSIQRYQYVMLEKEWVHKTVYIPCGEFPATQFQATTDEKIALMDSGRRGMEAFLSRIKGSAPPRRFSVA